METPIGTIYSTVALKAFTTIASITPEQFVLAIKDINLGDGAKISFSDLISSLISSDSGNMLAVGSDSLLKANPSSISFDDLSGTDKVIFGDTQYGGTISSDLNGISKSGFYSCYGTATGVPNSTYSWFVIHQCSNIDDANATQRAVAFNSSPVIYERVKASGVWGSWTSNAIGANQDLSNLSATGENKFNPDKTSLTAGTTNTLAEGGWHTLTNGSSSTTVNMFTSSDTDKAQVAFISFTTDSTSQPVFSGATFDYTPSWNTTKRNFVTIFTENGTDYAANHRVLGY